MKIEMPTDFAPEDFYDSETEIRYWCRAGCKYRTETAFCEGRCCIRVDCSYWDVNGLQCPERVCPTDAVVCDPAEHVLRSLNK